MIIWGGDKVGGRVTRWGGVAQDGDEGDRTAGDNPLNSPSSNPEPCQCPPALRDPPRPHGDKRTHTPDPQPPPFPPTPSSPISS